MKWYLTWFSIISIVSLAAGSPLQAASDFTEAYREAASGAWQHPVLSTDEDPREVPDISTVLQSGHLGIFTPEYFPGWVLHTARPELTLFHRLTQEWRVDGPTRVALSLNGQVKVFEKGFTLSEEELEDMDKPWLLVWFADARGWEQFDMPVLLVLQHKLTGLELADSLKLQAEESLGQVAMLNLYGYYKPPQDNVNSLRFAGTGEATETGLFGEELGTLAPQNIRPYEWQKTLPEHVIKRCDYFAGLTRAIPVHLRDDFQVDLSQDVLRIRNTVTYHKTEDDWGTEPIRLAPVSPAFALASQYGLPVSFSQPLTDPVYPTGLGPFAGIEGTDTYQVELALLQYLSEAVVYELNTESEDPLVQDVVSYMTNEIALFPYTSKPFGPRESETGVPDGQYPEKDIKGQNFCWGVENNDKMKAMACAMLDGELLEKARTCLRPLFTHSYFTEEGFNTAYLGDKEFFWRMDAGIHGDVTGDPGKLVNAQLSPAWMYAWYARDYDWIHGKEELMEKCHNLLGLTGWARAGREGTTEMGDQGDPALGFARLMYAARDQRRFAWGAYVFTMELVQMFNKCGPMGHYVSRFQPWHRYERMSDTENATDTWGGDFGWSIGGPGRAPLPLEKSLADQFDRHGTGQWNARLNRFGDICIGRFFREQCVDTTRGLAFEFDAWQQRDFSDLGPEAEYRQKGPNMYYANPAVLFTFRKQFKGESIEQLREGLNGYPLSRYELMKSTWNFAPFPFSWWALPDTQQVERIMGREVLPWTPGRRSVYPSTINRLNYTAYRLGEADDVTGEPLPPFPFVGRWFQPAQPKGTAWGLGYITVAPEQKVGEAVRPDEQTAFFVWSQQPVEPDPYDLPLEGSDWRFKIDPEGLGIKEGWYQSSFDDSSWAPITVPGSWEDQGYTGDAFPKGHLPAEIHANRQPQFPGGYDGAAWYRLEVEIPEAYRGLPLFFHAGVIDDFDITYFNGEEIGFTDTRNTETWWRATRLYPIDENQVNWGGKNTLTVLVGDNNANGGILKGPVRIIAKKAEDQ